MIQRENQRFNSPDQIVWIATNSPGYRHTTSAIVNHFPLKKHSLTQISI